jgi:hypothetical protein
MISIAPSDRELMGRHARRPRVTCEACPSIDVREWQRHGLLRVGLPFTYSWTRAGEPLAAIDVRTEADAVVLTFKGSNEWRPAGQRVALVSTRCHLGGARPWFRCPCGRRVAKLYRRDAPVFACRQCCGLAYASQREIPRHRAILRAQRLKMRLGGSANLLDPLPERPRGMHRQTYYRWLHKAMAAQERSLALAIDDIRRRYPGLLSEENVAESCFPPRSGPGS